MFIFNMFSKLVSKGESMYTGYILSVTVFLIMLKSTDFCTCMQIWIAYFVNVYLV